MYDYLAKIILLGPSGTGKYVQPLPLPHVPVRRLLTQMMSLDLVYFIDLLRTNGGSCHRKPSVSNSPVKLLELELDPGGKGSNCR